MHVREAGSYRALCTMYNGVAHLDRSWGTGGIDSKIETAIHARRMPSRVDGITHNALRVKMGQCEVPTGQG